MQHDQQRRQVLGDDAGQRHAVRRHVALDDEEQVQRHVHHTRRRQVDEGALGIAGGAEHAVAEVIKRHGGHAEGVDLQIQCRAVDQLRLGVQQRQHGAGQQIADQQQDDACRRADQERGVDGLFHLLPIPQAKAVGHRHIDAAADTDQQSREQRYQQRGGAHRTQRPVVGELSRDGHVAEVKQHLQHLRQHQRQAEQQDILPQRACGHFDDALFPCHSRALLL